MKNKTLAKNKSTQNKIPTWLYQDTQEDDFLPDKTPNNPEFTIEDEE
jgi:hypothetical protein